MAADRSSIPHEMAAMRGLAAATSPMFSRPCGVSVAIRMSLVDPNGSPCFSSRRSSWRHDAPHVVSGARLGDDVAVRPRGDGFFEVWHGVLGEDGIHPDPALAPAEVERLEPAADDGPRGGLQRRGHGVLEVEDEPVGGERERLGDHLLLAAGDEVERAAHAQPVFLRIMAARRQRMTRSPCWFFARCSKVTMPHSGRDLDSRFSTTSVSE